MILAIAAYLAGVLTLLSPCLVPVLPFVLARVDRPFLTGTLPFLAGLGAAFVVAAGFATLGGGVVAWLGMAGRVLALSVLAVFALTLLSPRASAWLHRPLVRLGGILSRRAAEPGARLSSGIPGSLGLGAATGLLWTPCAGPILGLVLTGAALNGPGWQTTALLAAYASGAATALAAVSRLGGAVVALIRPHLGLGERLRQVAGAAMIAVLAAVALGADADLLARYPAAATTTVEDAILTMLRVDPARAAPTDAPAGDLPVEGRLPSLSGATHWLNGEPQTVEGLRGRVVLVHVWTYSCINCIRTLPTLRAWAERYRAQGLAVIGIHAPEFAFEHDIGHVAAAIRRFALPYPVAVDNEFRLWRGLRNAYWPALYVVDAQGRIRHHQFGEGGTAQADAAIQALLAESAGGRASSDGPTPTRAAGIEAAPDLAHLASTETYVGSDKATHFVSPEGVSPGPRLYTPGRPRLNEWSLAGHWTIEPEYARLDASGGSTTYRFRARDLHLVVGPGPDGRPVPFDVSLDGEPPGADHGADIGSDGGGVIAATRLYQLVRQSGPVRERTFAIRFHRPGARVYAFTFG